MVPSFRWLLFIDIPSSFAEDAGFDPMGGSRHFRHPHTPILVRERFRGFTTVRLRYDLSICSPSCRSRPGFHQAYEDFYFRASDGLVTRSAAGYNYRGNWASSPGRTFTC